MVDVINQENLSFAVVARVFCTRMQRLAGCQVKEFAAVWRPRLVREPARCHNGWTWVRLIVDRSVVIEYRHLKPALQDVERHRSSVSGCVFHTGDTPVMSQAPRL